MQLKELLNSKILNSTIDFIHVPKTGGTSLKKLIDNNKKLSMIIKHHRHERSFYSLHNSNYKSQNNYAIMVIREPFSWYKSIYNFKMNSDPNCSIKIYPSMKNNSWRDFVNDCILIENGLTGIYKWFRPWEIYHNQYLKNIKEGEGLYSAILRFYSSCDLLGNPTGHDFLPHSHKLFILRQENLEYDFNSFLLKLINIDKQYRIEKINKSFTVSNFEKYFLESDIDIINNRDKQMYDFLNNHREF